MTRPVTIWENEAVNGNALSDDIVYAYGMQQVEALRKQQSDYLATLPVEPAEVIGCALDVMYPEGDSYPEGFEEAMHLSLALRPMVERLDTSEPGRDRDALLYIIDRIEYGLRNAAEQLDHLGDILGNPGRIKREANRA